MNQTRVIMRFIPRHLSEQFNTKLKAGKVLIIQGARRVGKTLLVKKFLSSLNESYLQLNGDDIHVHDVLANQTIENYRQLLGSNRLLFIDEAQNIANIGQKLKLMVDEIEGLRVIITGSSTFDILNNAGEPLTGRKYTFNLYPFAESEINDEANHIDAIERMKNRLVYGSYPEVHQFENQESKQDYLNDLISSYLLKDILIYEDVKNAQKIFNLLRLIAFQIGGEVSLQELGKQLGLSKNTVEKYLDLLTKVFILHKIEGFSKNLRKEITKNSRWYFVDNGIRNAIIANYQPVAARNDVGLLWKNYLVSERIKFQGFTKMRSNNYFWCTYQQQEIDWVEEREGQLYGYEFKWNKDKAKIPTQWSSFYPDAYFEIISPTNYKVWLRPS